MTVITDDISVCATGNPKHMASLHHVVHSIYARGRKEGPMLLSLSGKLKKTISRKMKAHVWLNKMILNCIRFYKTTAVHYSFSMTRISCGCFICIEITDLP
jgi:hypothetical protein